MIRDMQSSAIIETDLTELDKYRRDKKKMREIQALRRDVDELKEIVSNINYVLQKMAEK